MTEDRRIEDVWSDPETGALTKLRDKFSKDVYERWIEVINPASSGPGKIELQVGNSFYADWLRDHYLGDIKEAIQSSGGDGLEIHLTVEEKPLEQQNLGGEIQPPKEKNIERKSRRAGKKSSLVFIAPTKKLGKKEYALDRFVLGGESNDFAFKAVQQLVEGNGDCKFPHVFITGATGLGKTHLTNGAAIAAAKKQGRKVVHMSGSSFVQSYSIAAQYKDWSEFDRQFRGADIIVVDDIGFVHGKKGSMDKLEQILNDHTENGGKTLISGIQAVKEMQQLPDTLAERINLGIRPEITKPNFDQRLTMVEGIARNYDITGLSDEAKQYIARNIPYSVRALQAALIHVSAYTSLTGRQVETPMLKTLLRDVVVDEVERLLTPDKIEKEVAAYFGVPVTDLKKKGNRRGKKQESDARQMAMTMMYELQPRGFASQPAIAKRFGFENGHTNVHHATKKVGERMKDPAYRQDYNAIKGRVLDGLDVEESVA